MENYKKIFTQIEDINFGSIPKENISYSKSLFIRDLIEKPDFAWEKYLAKLLDKTNDAEKVIFNLLDKIEYIYLERHLEHDFDYWGDERSIENHRGKIVFFNTNHLDFTHFSKLINCKENLTFLKVEIVDCIGYYKAEMENPPYKEILIKSNKIPFFGSQGEFSALFVLLNKVGYLGIKDNNEFSKKDYDFLDNEKFRELSKLIKTKTKALNILSENFFLVEFNKESKNFKETFLNDKSMGKKFDDGAITRLGDIPRESLLEKLKKAVDFLDKEKEAKNQKDHF